MQVFLSIVSAVLTIGVIAAGALVFRRQVSKELSEIQTRVISALREENETLTGRVEDLQQEVTDLRATIATIRVVLRDRGINIRIKRDTVEFEDVGAPRRTVVRTIRKDQVEEIATRDDAPNDAPAKVRAKRDDPPDNKE